MYRSKKEEERARVAKIREAARISGREARVKEGLANISTGKVRECRQLKSNGVSTAQGNGTHGISSRVGIKGGPNNNNNNGPNHNNNNNKRRREREDRRRDRR